MFRFDLKLLKTAAHDCELVCANIITTFQPRSYTTTDSETRTPKPQGATNGTLVEGSSCLNTQSDQQLKKQKRTQSI